MNDLWIGGQIFDLLKSSGFSFSSLGVLEGSNERILVQN